MDKEYCKVSFYSDPGTLVETLSHYRPTNVTYYGFLVKFASVVPRSISPLICTFVYGEVYDSQSLALHPQCNGTPAPVGMDRRRPRGILIVPDWTHKNRHDVYHRCQRLK